jgi:hypothetical protein
MKVWRYNDIGVGKTINCKYAPFTAAYSVTKDFSSHFRKSQLSYDPKAATEKSMILFCHDDACSATFTNENDLTLHSETAIHSYHAEHGLSTIDNAKLMFARFLKSKTSDSRLPVSINDSSSPIHDVCGLWNNCTEKGWAVPKRKKAAHLTENQRQFLQRLFADGQKTKRKCTPENAIHLMKSTTNDFGEKLFAPHDYLRKEQVISYFSRLSAVQRTLPLDADTPHVRQFESSYQ